MEDSLLQKIDIDDDLKLVDLIEIPILEKMQNSFAKMARMAALTIDCDGVEVISGSDFTELCSEYCRKSTIGKSRCKNCDRMGAIQTLENKKSVPYKCHANLVNFAAPIMLGDKMLGGLVGGQVLAEVPDEEEMRRVAAELEIDEETFIAAANKIQVIPQAAINRSAEFLFEFAQILSEMAYNAYVSKQLSREAMQAAVQKQDFLANMSHEIRTPMNAVLGMAEMAMRESMSDAARDYVSQIQASGKHLLVIINDILDFSKIDSGKMTLAETVYETEALLSDLASVVNSRIGDKDIEFIVDVPCDMPIELYGDYVRIHQILLNLLNNAIKFTHSGCVKLKIDFAPIDEENVMFSAAVIDTGNGIKKEDLDKLFTSFQQVDSKRNRNVEGTGLGLTISKQLVELMGGSISVESEYGKGSAFSVEFPQKVQTKGEAPVNPDEPVDVYLYLKNKYIVDQIKRDFKGIHCNLIDLNETDFSDFRSGSYIIMEREDDTDAIRDMASKFSDGTVIALEKYDTPNDLEGDNIKTIKKPGYSKKILALMGLATAYSREQVSDEDIFSFVAPEAHVLIVDDNPINLTVAKGLMEPLSMQVDTAINAQECIALIQNKKYNIIFMDHMMPGVDGIETTHIIRRMYTSYEDVPIIALTANATGGAQEMFLAEGMNDFVAKPIETKKIVAKIRQWLPDHLIIPVDLDARKLEDVAKEDSIVDKIDIPGLNVKGALALLRNEKLYLNFLKEYYNSIDEKAEKIQAAYDADDIHTYTIEVHALKSSSRQIGAEALALDAERLEKAGNENDRDVIDAGTFKLIWDYKSLKKRLAVLYENEASDEKVTLNAEVVKGLVDNIARSIEDFDFVSVDEAFGKLSEYTIEREDEKKLLEEIKAAADEFDAEAFTALADKWLKLYE